MECQTQYSWRRKKWGRSDGGEGGTDDDSEPEEDSNEEECDEDDGECDAEEEEDACKMDNVKKNSSSSLYLKLRSF